MQRTTTGPHAVSTRPSWPRYDRGPPPGRPQPARDSCVGTRQLKRYKTRVLRCRDPGRLRRPMMAEPRGSASSRDGFRPGAFDVQTRCEAHVDHFGATAMRSTKTASTTSPPTFGAGSRPPSSNVPAPLPAAGLCVLHAGLRAAEACAKGRVTRVVLAQREREV